MYLSSEDHVRGEKSSRSQGKGEKEVERGEG